MTPSDVVRSFVEAWNAYDLERILAHLHEDVVYHNVPVEPILGRAAVRAYLHSKGGFERMQWKLLAIAESGNKVLTERVDEFTLWGVEVSLPLMGIFEIDGDRIRAWRDYFDMEMYQRQLHTGRRA
jgi:limonene-1,2-epoxide hydrolase